MKKVIIVAIAMGMAVPAQAGLLSGANLINVAKTVLGNSAILNKAQTNCPTQVTTQPQESVLMTAAKAAVQKALPGGQFGRLQAVADATANKASADPTFCETTAVKKPGLLGGIADAAKKLGVGGGLLGGGTTTGGGSIGNVLGGLLGGGTTSTPSTPAPSFPVTN